MHQVQVVQHSDVELRNEILSTFFEPVEFDGLAQLAAAFEAKKEQIIRMHALIQGEEFVEVLHHFMNGNSTTARGLGSNTSNQRLVDEVFGLTGAINNLTATYWQLALDQTGLMEHMPQKRRYEWHECLTAWREPGYKPGVYPAKDMPAFNLDTLRGTVDSLLARRAEFLSERVDGIFKALSPNHVTNLPHAFSKRLIIHGCYDGSGYRNHNQIGYIHDLRLIVAKFMGRDEPLQESTNRIMEFARLDTGEWKEMDGGSVRVRAYMLGTAHLEVHPEIAWRLNAILAFLYPIAIPAELRRKPSKAKSSGFSSKALFDRPLSNAVTGILGAMTPYAYLEKTQNFRNPTIRRNVKNAMEYNYRSVRDISKHLRAEVDNVLAALGGVLTRCKHNEHSTYWQFDFNPESLISNVAAMGSIPDIKSYQFYPTPAELGSSLVEWLEVGPADSCLEPEAGQGGIADLLPRDRTLCIEISALHCEILAAKGHNVIEADFLTWNTDASLKFSIIAMNPPFSEGRWQEHLKHASSMVEPGGRIGAILPMSARNMAAGLLPGFDVEVSDPVDNAFAGTSISVLMMRATRHAA